MLYIEIDSLHSIQNIYLIELFIFGHQSTCIQCTNGVFKSQVECNTAYQNTKCKWCSTVLEYHFHIELSYIFISSHLDLWLFEDPNMDTRDRQEEAAT